MAYLGSSTVPGLRAASFLACFGVFLAGAPGCGNTVSESSTTSNGGNGGASTTGGGARPAAPP